MEPITTVSPANLQVDQIAWNQAHDRLLNYLNTFVLRDHCQVSRLTLRIVDQCRSLPTLRPTLHPTTLVMEQMQRLLHEWLEGNVTAVGRTAQEPITSGCLAMLLSQSFLAVPNAFLVTTLPVEIRQSMDRILVVTGPDLDLSSMTSRKVDYGPMLVLANQTWHRWDARSVLFALLFWAVVYVLAYLVMINF